ncbi:LPS assembly protein LptD [uncultured Croceicoccus sp.]|uniref:LPS-assembly protein LptD n=1 Tax=uncultured Croceicoccus sp. TaxID=1295329 RepID=UPI00260DFDA3|nr:LPS assembly protein LptD [uncultured Croceicoccus sp.]
MPPRADPVTTPFDRTAAPDRSPVRASPCARHWLTAASLGAMAVCAAPALAQATGPDAPQFWDEGDPDNQPEIDENRPDGAAPGDDRWYVPAFELDEPADGTVGFAADELQYDTEQQIVTASGNVLLRRGRQEVRADTVEWNRASGAIVAAGNVRSVDDGGNVLYTDRIALTEELRAGALENLLIVLGEGGRLAARSGTRADDGSITLDSTNYTACAIETGDGCPKRPSWRITARQVHYDPATQKIDFDGARLVLFDTVALPLPTLSILAADRAVSGITSPNLRFTQSNGVQVSAAYYMRIAPNRELTLGANVYSDVLPMVSARYRALTEKGAYQVTGYATSSSRVPVGNNPTRTEQESFRGYLDGNGRYNLNEHLSVTGSVRVTTDRTFLRRYDISRDDRLRSTVSLRRIDDDSFFEFTGWGAQTLRFGDDQGQVPFALPLIDYRRRVDDPLLGGRIMLQANSLALVRTDGQDTQRAFAGATWSRHAVTPWGQQVTATALLRGDVYHSDENDRSTILQYRGDPGWHGRGIALGAVDVKWPLTGGLFGGQQVLTPRVQLVAAPQFRNRVIPNEDSRAIDLEDSNLFALNRFPGYDRVEDGTRFTYGLDWRWTRPDWRALATIGQSYRITRDDTLLPDGTGLVNRTSDVVGRAELRFRDFVKAAYRFRIDKDNLAFRRNEWDLTVGTRETYAEIGYLKLDRNIPVVLEDLQDREELRLAGRYAFASYWSVFGSTVINLTDQAINPQFASDGFEALRTRLGVAYDDECLQFAVTWRYDNFESGDVQRGSTFLFDFALRNLGL